MERLDKRLVGTGNWSRKEAKELAKAGRVTVNGQVVRQSDVKVEETDLIAVDGNPIEAAGPV